MVLNPAQTSAQLVENQPFIDIRNARHEAVTLNSATVDSGNTPTTQLRKGLVVGERSDGAFIDAEDATVVGNTAASITSAEAVDSDWVSKTLTASIPSEGLTVTVTAGGSDDTAAKYVTLLMADTNFAANFLAVALGSSLVITARRKGIRIEVSSNLSTAFAANASSTGTMTKYGILAASIPSMLGIADAATDHNASIITANAIVREANLLNLTAEARQYFAAKGIQLV